MSPVKRRKQVDETWRQRAACRGMDTEEFFPHVSAEGEVPISTRAEVNKSLKVCQSCPVKTECYSYAQYFGHRQGIWGGVLLNKRGPRSRMMSSNA